MRRTLSAFVVMLCAACGGDAPPSHDDAGVLHLYASNDTARSYLFTLAYYYDLPDGQRINGKPFERVLFGPGVTSADAEIRAPIGTVIHTEAVADELGPNGEHYIHEPTVMVGADTTTCGLRLRPTDNTGDAQEFHLECDSK